MLILDGKTDLNKISLTGVRAIMMIGLLALAPRSLEEIREKFLAYKIMEKSHSDDILRIDLNTIKAMGCEISRSSPKTGFKYVLGKHPFMLTLTDEDIKILKKIFDKIKTCSEFSVLMEYDSLLKKLSAYINDDETKNALLGVSPLARYDVGLIDDLITDCKYKNTLELVYHKTTSKKPYPKKLVAQKLIIRNDKVYLLGYNTSAEAPIMLNVKHIQSVISRELTKTKPEIESFKVRFYLKDFSEDMLTDEETVTENKDGVIIEGNYFNSFIAAQRILSLGSNCIVKEPEAFKNAVVSKLKEMRALYEQKK